MPCDNFEKWRFNDATGRAMTTTQFDRRSRKRIDQASQIDRMAVEHRCYRLLRKSGKLNFGDAFSVHLSFSVEW
jgi:hypothetical protein